jgi:hypothetical protein
MISAHIVSVTTDSAGYRVVAVTVVVRGPASVNVAYCGSPAPVNVWAVNAAGRRLSGGRASSQLCMAPKLEPIPAGTSRSFDGSAQFPQGSGPVTIHGRVALAGAGPGDNLPVLTTS